MHLAARDRTGVAIAKPKTPFVRVDELGDQISGNAWRAFNMDKTGFERETGLGGFEHLAAPSSPSRRRRGLSRRSLCRQSKYQKSGRERDSLMRGKTSLIVRFNSLQGRKKFPVPERRELARKALI